MSIMRQVFTFPPLYSYSLHTTHETVVPSMRIHTVTAPLSALILCCPDSTLDCNAHSIAAILLSETPHLFFFFCTLSIFTANSTILNYSNYSRMCVVINVCSILLIYSLVVHHQPFQGETSVISRTGLMLLLIKARNL